MENLTPETVREETERKMKIFSRKYWYEAANELKSVKTIVFAALIIALRVAVKSLRIPIMGGLSLTFDCYINSLGSLVYGPVVALLAGAVSDTVGAFLFPSGPYFFPFVFVEMSSSFIFALFLWRKDISVPRVMTAKFTVNFISNIILTSSIMKFQYWWFGDDKFYTYNIINATRIVKNLIMFPIEAILISLILTSLFKALKSLKVIPRNQSAIKFRTKDIILAVFLTGISIGLVLFYVFFLKDFVSAHNFKLL